MRPSVELALERLKRHANHMRGQVLEDWDIVEKELTYLNDISLKLEKVVHRQAKDLEEVERKALK